MKKLLLGIVFLFFGMAVQADTFPLDLSGCVMSGRQILLTGWFNEIRDAGQHSAIDIPANLGTNVYAFRAGRVVGKFFEAPKVGKQSYGNCIIVEEQDGYRRYYAHLSTYDVLLNKDIAEGQYIGTVGYSGMSYVCPHLHIELRNRNNVKVIFTNELANAARDILTKDPVEFVFELRRK